MIKRFFAWVRSLFAKAPAPFELPARLVKQKARESWPQRMARERAERKEKRREALRKIQERPPVKTYTAACQYKYCGGKFEVPSGTIQKFCSRRHRAASRSHSYGTA